MSVHRPEYDVPDLTNDLVVRTANLGANDLIRPQSGGELVDTDKRQSANLITASLLGASVTNKRFPSCELLICKILVIIAQRTHRGYEDQFPDIGQETIAILMSSGGRPLAARDAGAEETALQHGAVLRHHRHDDGRVRRPWLLWIIAAPTGTSGRVELAEAAGDGPPVETGGDFALKYALQHPYTIQSDGERRQ